MQIIKPHQKLKRMADTTWLHQTEKRCSAAGLNSYLTFSSLQLL